jgi:uncharacterized metal-binding protein
MVVVLWFFEEHSITVLIFDTPLVLLVLRKLFFFLGLVVAKNISDSVDEWYYMAVKKG